MGAPSEADSQREHASCFAYTPSTRLHRLARSLSLFITAVMKRVCSNCLCAPGPFDPLAFDLSLLPLWYCCRCCAHDVLAGSLAVSYRACWAATQCC